jgi:hypothetical protein
VFFYSSLIYCILYFFFFLNNIGKIYKLILVIPPPLANIDRDAAKQDEQKEPVFDKEDFDTLKDTVDAFSLMTYDYASNNHMIGPNAPLDWMEANVDHLLADSKEYNEKILLGLNFYGMKSHFFLEYLTI